METLRGMLIDNKFIEGKTVDGEFIRDPRKPRHRTAKIHESRERCQLRYLLGQERSQLHSKAFAAAIELVNPGRTPNVEFVMTIAARDHVNDAAYELKMTALMPKYAAAIRERIASFGQEKRTKQAIAEGSFVEVSAAEAAEVAIESEVEPVEVVAPAPSKRSKKRAAVVDAVVEEAEEVVVAEKKVKKAKKTKTVA